MPSVETRRDFLKKTCYVAPAVLTVAVRPVHARSPYTIGNGPKTQTERSGNHGSSGDGSAWWLFWERM